MASGVKGASSTIAFLSGMTAKAKLASTFAVGAMAQKAKAHCAEMISLTDHTQKDLDRLGNPYAKRHGPDGLGLHDPPEEVHSQTGALLAGLKATAPIANASGARATVVNTDEKDGWIQDGTTTMVARPYMAAVKRIYGDEIAQAGSDELQARLDLNRTK